MNLSREVENKSKIIGGIGNYYGKLSVVKHGIKYFWSIENYDGQDWQEITKKLYKTLIEFEENSL